MDVPWTPERRLGPQAELVAPGRMIADLVALLQVGDSLTGMSALATSDRHLTQPGAVDRHSSNEDGSALRLSSSA